MTEPVLPHFGIGWKMFRAHSRVFIISMLVLFGSWVVLEAAVVALQQFGLVVWLVLHIAFFMFSSGLMIGLYRMALESVAGNAPNLKNLTVSLRQGPSFLLAFCVYILAVAGGVALLIVPGIYLAVRYAFFGQVLATESTSALGALRNAGAISDGHWWTLCVFLFSALLLNLAGAAFLGIGLLVTFPVALLAASDLYRSLQRSSRPVLVPRRRDNSLHFLAPPTR